MIPSGRFHLQPRSAQKANYPWVMIPHLSVMLGAFCAITEQLTSCRSLLFLPSHTGFPLKTQDNYFSLTSTTPVQVIMIAARSLLRCFRHFSPFFDNFVQFRWKINGESEHFARDKKQLAKFDILTFSVQMNSRAKPGFIQNESNFRVSDVCTKHWRQCCVSLLKVSKARRNKNQISKRLTRS